MRPLPENRQGVLLPGNTDPWKKEYFDPSVAEVAALCSYLEVKGSYRDRSGGLQARHTYRMYLGQDAVTDFDVIRNTEYTLTLIVSDLGVYRESWKVDRGDVTDGRQLYFDPPFVEIAALGSAQTQVVSNPAGIDYHLEWDSGAFAAAFLSEPDLSGNRITLNNTAEVETDRSLILQALSFDGQVAATCTLLVKAGSLPDLEASWASEIPSHVAQAGLVRCSQIFEGSVLTASSGNPSVARLVRQGNDFRVECLKAGRTRLQFVRTDGNRTSTCTLDLTVSPVYLQTAGLTYRAFADGASNALRIVAGHEPWALSYDLPRSRFDDALYEELLSPQYTAVKSGGSTSVDYFEIDEHGLYVVSWGSDLSLLAGQYAVALTPRANIYEGAMVVLNRTVVVDAPLQIKSGSVIAGENRYYMPDPGERMSLLSSGAAGVNLGDPSSLKICIGHPLGGYGEGSGYVPCPYEATESGTLCLRPSYEDLVRYFPSPYRFRGNLLTAFARLTNRRSGKTADLRLCNVEVWLGFAVTSRLERWGSSSDWDVTDEDHFFLVPCLYDERFEPGLITFHASQAGGGGDVSLPPFYVPQAVLTGIPDRMTVDGARINLSETYPPHSSGAGTVGYALHCRERGTVSCPDVTNWLWDECGWTESDYDCDAYAALSGRTGTWFHKKLYWVLYDPNARQTVADGGWFDIKSYGGYTGNYYLRFHDYAEPLDPSDFDE